VCVMFVLSPFFLNISLTRNFDDDTCNIEMHNATVTIMILCCDFKFKSTALYFEPYIQY